MKVKVEQSQFAYLSPKPVENTRLIISASVDRLYFIRSSAFTHPHTHTQPSQPRHTHTYTHSLAFAPIRETPLCCYVTAQSRSLLQYALLSLTWGVMCSCGKTPAVRACCLITCLSFYSSNFPPSLLSADNYR